MIEEARAAPGETLRERLRRGPLPPAEALRAARDVLEALREAHARGAIHGAVSPSAIVVQGGRAMLIDFGAEPSAAYLSPEQAGSIGRGVDARSDLYSLGVTLYEAVSGAPPFPAGSTSELLRAHLTLQPPPLHAPRALEDLIQRLLRKHPRDRTASAAEALDDVVAAEALLGKPFEPLPPRPGRAALGEPRLAGRGEELGRLLALLGQPEGRVAAIESEPGGGKTRLLDELARAGHERSALVIRASGGARALVASVAAACKADPALGPALSERLGAERGAAAAAFPALPLGAPDPPAPEEHAPARARRALLALLSALGTPRRPALILLDDFEDEPPPPAPHALVVLARPPSGDAAGLDAVFRLAPLSGAEQRAMAQSMAGPLPEAALEAIVRRSGGNPQLLESDLRAMVESGVLAPGPEGFTADPGALAALPAPRDAGLLLARRLELLPEAALTLLSCGAILGTSFEPSRAAALAGPGSAEALALLDEGRRRQLVTTDAAGKWSFTHARVREALLEKLEPGERRRLHLAAAEQATGEGALATHLDAASEHARALPHALAAADAARAQLDFDEALRLLRIAGRGAASAGEPVRARVFEQLAAVLTVRGRLDEAEAELDRALALTRTPLDRARLLGRMGDLAFRRGDHAASSRALEEALSLLGRPPPRRALAAVLLEVLRRALPRGKDASAEDRLAAELHGKLTWPSYFQRGPLFTLWTHLRELSLAERLGDSPLLSQAYGNHAVALAQIPWFSRTLDYAGRAVEVARRIGDPWQQARARHVRALVLFWACRYREGLDAGREALRELERLGDPGEANAARFTVASCLYRLGFLREAAELARRQHRLALEMGGAVAIAGGVELWAKASGGEVPAAAIAESIRRCGEGDAVLATLLHTAEGIRLLRERRVDAAVDELERSDGLLRKARFRNGLVADAPAYLAAALRARVESLPPLAIVERRRQLRRARKAARRAVRLARRFPKALPHALRESALIEALAGRPRAAERLLREGLEVAERQEARAEALRARLALAELAGDRDADALASLRALGDEPALPTLSLADRYAQVLRVGRALATALAPEGVHDRARAAALELLRADSCAVVPLPLAADAGPLAARAVAAGMPLVDDGGGEACAPIVARGAAVACLCARSRRGGFGEEEERLLGFVAALAGAALENAEGVDRALRAEREVRSLNERAARTHEEERRKLALALHDGAGQTLSAAALQLGAAGRGLEGEKASRIERVRALIDATLDDLRGLSRDLRPAALDRLGLVPALRELAASSSTPELSVELRADPSIAAPPPDSTLFLYRIAQSALSNVARHARASRAVIALEAPGGRFRLCVEDDGVGFDPAALPREAGIGLAGMRERAGWLGGTFDVESAPGRGTKVRVEI